ncbi:MAG: hypothetical protein J0M28_02620 [Thauera sp.]|nr:hypothetical protein [Thauera sp.]
MSALKFARRNSQPPAPVELDFVPIRRAPGWPGWALLAVGALCALAEVQGLVDARADLAERIAIVGALKDRQLPAVARAPVAMPLTAQELAGVQRVSARLGTDWSEVFAALSRVRGADLAWVEVDLTEARDAQRGLRLAGEARTLGAVLEVIDRMRREPALSGIELVSHEAATSNGVAFVRFVVATRNQGAN